MVVKTVGISSEDAISRAERMVADFYWDKQNDLEVREVAERLWPQFHLSPSEVKAAAIMGIVAGANGIITSYCRVGRIDEDKSPTGELHILGLLPYVVSGTTLASMSSMVRVRERREARRL